MKTPEEKPNTTGRTAGGPEARTACPDTPGRGRDGLRAWWGPVGLMALVAAAYGQTVAFDLVWDDHVLVLGNPGLWSPVLWREVLVSPGWPFQDPMPAFARMYRPLWVPMVAMEAWLWGAHPAGFHAASVLVHLVAVLLLWRLAARITGSPWAAFAAGALLAVHPSAVGAVAFVSARMDLFVGLGVAAVFLLLRGCLARGGTWRVVGALVSFAGALASKETAMAIPALVTWVAWVYPAWFAGASPAAQRAALALRVIPFWLVLGLYAVLRRAVLGGLAPIPLHQANVPEQVLRALAAVATYAQVTLIPRPPTGYIRVESPEGLADGRVLLGLALTALLVAGLLILRQRHPASAFALGWYGIALVPASNLLPIYERHGIFVIEGSLYPALAGWCLFLAVVAHALCARTAAGPVPRRMPALLPPAGMALVATFLAVTAMKASAWRNDTTLWTAAVLADPGSAAARFNLVAAIARSGDLEGAHTAGREAAAQFPTDSRIAQLSASLAENRGATHEARETFERTIALRAPAPAAYRQAALLAARLREWERAGYWFATAAERFPRAAWPHMGLAWYHRRQGRAASAEAHAERAERLEPRSPEPYWVLSQLLAAEGLTAEAIQASQAALALDPSFVPALRALALTAEQAGKTEEAIGYWRRIVAVLPVRHRAEAEDHLRRLEGTSHVPEAAGAGPARPR